MRALNSEQPAPFFITHSHTQPPSPLLHRQASRSQSTCSFRNIPGIASMGMIQSRTSTATLCLALWPNSWLFDSSVQFLCPMARANCYKKESGRKPYRLNIQRALRSLVLEGTQGHGRDLPQDEETRIPVCPYPALLFGDCMTNGNSEAALGRWWQFHSQPGL